MIKKVSILIQKMTDWVVKDGDSIEEDQTEVSWCFLVKVLNLFQKSIHSQKLVKSSSPGVVPFLVLVL